MTAILAIFANDGYTADEALVTRMLGRMGSRGGARASVWREGGVVIAISRHEWEFGPGFSGPVLIVQDGDHVIAADASLYYRDDLRRKLAAKGVRPKGQTPSHLILAAYQAYGEKCPEMLEGDFSFVIWDRRERRVVAASDFVGGRPLFFADLGGTLAIASAIGAILEHPRCDGKLDNEVLGLEVAALAFSSYDATCYSGIRRVEGASRLVSVNGSAARVHKYWTPIVREAPSASNFADAALELRELVGQAVIERLHPDDTTAVWMSGGWDSTAVFGAGQWKLAPQRAGDRLRPVSITHPVGDPGREDEKIAETAAFWNAQVAWLSAADAPLIQPLASRSLIRDEPIEHLFVGLNAALSDTCRSIGARVALDGYGGDVLFANSCIFLADLLARGRLISLARESTLLWKYGHRSRDFFRFAVQPLLSPGAQSMIARARGRKHLTAPFERGLPRWIDARFAAQHRLLERAHQDGSLPDATRHADAEIQWGLEQSFFMRTRASLCGVAFEQGVELRAPLYDQRVIDFSIGRPAAERNGMGEQKLLLREAMRGLLPETVLAPRPVKKGNLGGYLQTALLAAEPIIRAEIARPMLLSDLGIVEATAFRRAFDIFFRVGCQGPLRVDLLYTFLTELWLRARAEKGGDTPSSSRQSPSSLRQRNHLHSFTAPLAVLASGKINPDNLIMMEE
jgi:asparagine synthase (glutamine-hydrolysing)